MYISVCVFEEFDDARWLKIVQLHPDDDTVVSKPVEEFLHKKRIVDEVFI